jgi:hypothetical protein
VNFEEVRIKSKGEQDMKVKVVNAAVGFLIVTGLCGIASAALCGEACSFGAAKVALQSDR